MADIRRYVLVNRDDHEEDYEYESYDEAKAVAAKEGAAVIERTYEYADSELVWTPDGSIVWPPEKSVTQRRVRR